MGVQRTEQVSTHRPPGPEHRTIIPTYEDHFKRAQETLRTLPAIEMGNEALHLVPKLFDRTYNYIIASLNGTFDYPFTRDAMISGHFLRKAVDTFFGGHEHVDAQQKQDVGSPTSIWKNIANKVKDSNAFFWKHQKPNGSLTHEMQVFDPTHPFFRKGFYTREEENGGEFMINSDSIDSTPRAAMEAAVTLDANEIITLYPRLEKAFNWMKHNMDENFGFVGFSGNENGLMNQDWMDSQQGRPIDDSGKIIPGSVAMSEVQAQSWAAMKRWAYALRKSFADVPENKKYVDKANELEAMATGLKSRFNASFRTSDGYFANALVFPEVVHTETNEHSVSPIAIQDTRISINHGFILEADHLGETILETEDDIKNVVHHLMSSTMFHPNAGIYTFDRKSVKKNQNPDGYHFGEDVGWSFSSVLAAEGIYKVSEKMGWEEGKKLAVDAMLASIVPVLHTKTFLEQFTFNPETGQYIRFKHHTNDGKEIFSNATQTWTIAACLRVLAFFDMLNELDYTEIGKELIGPTTSNIRRAAMIPQVQPS